MKITICGSMQFNDEMEAAMQTLLSAGYDVEKPNVAEGHVYTDNLDANADLKRGFIDEHFRKIDDSDAILVINETKNNIDNYVGGNTLIEIAYAYSQGLEVFMLNPVPDISYAVEIRGMHPIIIDGDLRKIDEYFASLPLVFMSTESPVKHTAVSRALRRAGLRTCVSGAKVESGVNEQPFSIDETYEGALNRHKNLKNLNQKADYYATIESGQHLPHKKHNTFGCSVIILEPRGQDAKIGIDFDLEFPKAMTDKVPSQYPDLGALVQAEYGAALKDPFPYFTSGKLTRTKILENAVYNVAIQMEL